MVQSKFGPVAMRLRKESVMANPGLAAVQVGLAVGASAREVNRLLLELGYLSGSPGMLKVTQKGAEFATEVLRSSSDLPHAKTWLATYWNPRIIDVLREVATPEKLAQIRAAINADRIAKLAAEAAEQQRLEAMNRASGAFAHSLEQRSLKIALIGSGAIMVAVAGYGIYRLTTVAKRWRSERELAPEGQDAAATTEADEFADQDR